MERDASSSGEAYERLADLDAVLDRLAASSAADGCEALWLAITDPPPIELATAVAAALAKPVGTPPLHALARGRRTAVIIIDRCHPRDSDSTD